MSYQDTSHNLGSTRVVWVIGLVLVIIFKMAALCAGQGRLLDPPSRAVLWENGMDSQDDSGNHQPLCGGPGVSNHRLFFFIPALNWFAFLFCERMSFFF